MRRAQRAAGRRRASSQSKRRGSRSRRSRRRADTCASSAQRSRPVTGSSAITRPSGVDDVHRARRPRAASPRATRRGCRRLRLRLAGVKSPGDRQPADVLASDLRQRRHPRAAGIAAVARPVGRRGLRAGRRPGGEQRAQRGELSNVGRAASGSCGAHGGPGEVAPMIAVTRRPREAHETAARPAGAARERTLVRGADQRVASTLGYSAR